MVKKQCPRPLGSVPLLALTLALSSCNLNGEPPRDQAMNWPVERQQMVANQISARGVHDPQVLAALGKVPRHQFVPNGAEPLAYGDWPLSIGHGQTISQPYIVAFMTEAARIGPDDRVLEIGTGSGYQAAVLAEIAKAVYSIEIVEALGTAAAERLQRMGYENVTVRIGDGYQGWPEQAPFDAVLLTAAPPSIPRPLVEQLKIGGRLIAPVGGFNQQLVRLTKTGPEETREETLLPVRFVPMTGEAQRR